MAPGPRDGGAEAAARYRQYEYKAVRRSMRPARDATRWRRRPDAANARRDEWRARRRSTARGRWRRRRREARVETRVKDGIARVSW